MILDIGDEAVDHDSVKNMWSTIWKARILPKIKVFSWKLAAKSEAVGESLACIGV